MAFEMTVILLVGAVAAALVGYYALLVMFIWNIQVDERVRAEREYYQGVKPKVSLDADAEIEELIRVALLEAAEDPGFRRAVVAAEKESPKPLEISIGGHWGGQVGATNGIAGTVPHSFANELPDTCSIAKRLLKSRS